MFLIPSLILMGLREKRIIVPKSLKTASKFQDKPQPILSELQIFMKFNPDLIE